MAPAIKSLSPKDKTATVLARHSCTYCVGIAMPNRPKDTQPHDASKTRRAILAGAVAIPALGIQAIATELDPVFPSIERAREANAATQALGLCDDDEINAVCDMWRDAHRAAFRTVPTTAAGAVALIGYAVEVLCTHGHGGALVGDDPAWELIGDDSKPAGNSTVDLFQSLTEFLRKA
jgi:hypothetical protein